MWFFFLVAILVYIWPGHISGGAEALEELTGIPWQASATVGLLVIGVMFTVVTFIYNLIEGLLAFLVGVLVIGSAIVGAFVGSLSDLGDTLAGTVAFTSGIPDEAFTAAFFPIVVGALAFAGPSGMQQMWYTLWLRDKGAGMGVHVPKVRGLLHAGEEETIPECGSMFDTDDPDEMRKWKAWRKWVAYDALLLFFGITMLVTIIFTVMAMNAAELNPDARQALLDGDRDAALPAMADAFAEAASYFDTLFFIFIAIVGWKASVGPVRRVRPRPVRHDLLLHAGREEVQDGPPVRGLPVVRDPVRDHHPELRAGRRADADPRHPRVPVGLRDGRVLPHAGGVQQQEPAEEDPASLDPDGHPGAGRDRLPDRDHVQRHQVRRLGHRVMMPGADGQIAPATVRAPGAAPWEYLGRRQMLELAVPGIAIGVLCGIITGGALAAGGLALDVALFAGVTLAVPLALAGGGFELLLARGRFPLSALTPVVLFWAVAFPLVRILHAGVLDALRGGVGRGPARLARLHRLPGAAERGLRHRLLVAA